jgi:hypothetical protein
MSYIVVVQGLEKLNNPSTQKCHQKIDVDS